MMIIGAFCWVAIVLILFANTIAATALRFTVPPNSRKCLSIEIPDKTLVTGMISSNLTMMNQADTPRQGPITGFMVIELFL